MTTWTDERLDELAVSLRPLPAQVAQLGEAVERMTLETSAQRTELAAETRSLRGELAAAQQQGQEGMAEVRRELAAFHQQGQEGMADLRGELATS